MTVVNEKALVKLAKAATKGRLIWQYVEGTHYITDGSWAVKLPQLSAKVTGTLVELFGRMPEEGQSLVIQFKRFSDNGPDIQKIWKNTSSDMTKLIDTKLTLHQKEWDVRLLKASSDNLIAVNEKYYTLVDTGQVTSMQLVNGTSYFDDEILILPIQSKLGNYARIVGDILTDR